MRLLAVERLVVEAGRGRRRVRIVDEASLEVGRSETVALVGESGSGKTTLLRAVAMLIRPTAGSIRLDGIELTALAPSRLRELRPRMQLVFQDPLSSLNPRRRALEIVEEPLAIWRRGSPAERRARAAELLAAVGLDPARFADRRPHELSGGQCQRVGIARAIALGPELLLLDEPVSALDVSVQAQILELLADLRKRFGLAMLLVAHDLAVVKGVADRVAVMYLGRIVELAPASAFFASPAHPYAELLLASAPRLGQRRGGASARTGPPASSQPPSAIARPLEPPSLLEPPPGCRFHPRCPYATERCRIEAPLLEPIGQGRLVACHHPLLASARGSRGEADG
jgi:peptide/nickel transport system ATP-binding protein